MNTFVKILVLKNFILVSLWTYFAQCFSFSVIEFGQANTVWKDQVKWKIFIFNFLVPFFRPSLFRVVLFFYISIFGGSHRRRSVKKGFLEISQISQENTCVGISCCNVLRTPNFKNKRQRLPLNLSGILRSFTRPF